MLTRSGWAALLGSIITLVAGRVFGLEELLILGSVGIAICMVALLSVRTRSTLVVDRVIIPRRIHAGHSSRVELRVRNSGPRRSPVVNLVEPVQGTAGAEVSVAPLAPGDERTATYRLPTEKRGIVSVGPLECRRSDPFGLACRRSVVAAASRLTVLPALEPLHRLPSTGGLDDPLAGATRTALGARGSGDFASLRPYVPGDDLRRVHWASSARVGDLLVRQDDPPWQGHLTVLLDARSSRIDADDFERAVSAAASILVAVAAAGDRTRLVVTNGTDTGLVDARSSRDNLLEELAIVGRNDDPDLPDVPADGRRHTGGLVVLGGALDETDIAHFEGHADRFSSILVFVFDGDLRYSARPVSSSARTHSTRTVVIPATDGRFPDAWARAFEANA